MVGPIPASCGRATRRPVRHSNERKALIPAIHAEEPTECWRIIAAVVAVPFEAHGQMPVDSP